MNHCNARKAFDSLWSITDEIFKYVADIRATLNDAKGSEGDILPSDPPSYESSMPEQLFERLNQKVACLENLNEKRKTLLEEFSTALKRDDVDEKEQIREKTSKRASADLRDDALKTFLSYTRQRQTALKTNLDLLQQASQTVTSFCHQISNPDGRLQRAVDTFFSAMNRCANLNIHMSKDREALLREGKALEEALLKAQHEESEETKNIIRDVQHSYRKIEELELSTLCSQVWPILSGYVQIAQRDSIIRNVKSVVSNMQDSLNKYTINVQAYNLALQSLADRLDF